MQYNWLDWVGIVSLTKEALDNVRGGGEGYTLINSVYWTLSIEVQFYFVMYIAISFRRHWMIILGAVTLVSIVSLATSFLIWPGFFLQFWPAFFCGALLRLAYSRNLVPGLIFGKFELPGSVAVLGLILVLLLAREHIQPGITFIETAAAAALALWALGGIEHGCAARGKPVNAFRRLAGKLLIPFVLLGQCSYSLYLLHGKLYQLPSMFVRQLVPTTAPLHLVSIVLGTIVLSYAFYYLVERRYQGHAVSKPAQPQARPATCVVADEVS
jgi:peptidoglycan/LPS O-acetylase OafA/YrhL